MPVHREVVSGLLGRQFTKGLTKAKGAILGTNIGRGRNNSPGAAMQNRGKHTTTVLQYPFSVDSDPMQGHYILFNINVNKQAKIRHIKGQTPQNIIKGLAKEFNTGIGKIEDEIALGEHGGIAKVAGRITGVGSPDILSAPAGSPDSAYKGMLAGSSRLATSIALYMPPSVNVSYTPSYADVDIKGWAGLINAGANIIKSFAQGEGVSQADVDEGVGAIEVLVKKGSMATMDAFAPGMKALMQIQAGSIISSKMELSFEGVGRRDFTYSFIFIPKSEQEAQVVEQIISMFKLHAMPEWGGGEEKTVTTGHRGTDKVTKHYGRTMTIPDTFDIDYMYRGAKNSFLNEISTCFCTGVQVAYGGDRFVAYDETQGMHGSGTPPQRTTLTLNFKEMEIITRERVAQGY